MGKEKKHIQCVYSTGSISEGRGCSSCVDGAGSGLRQINAIPRALLVAKIEFFDILAPLANPHLPLIDTVEYYIFAPDAHDGVFFFFFRETSNVAHLFVLHYFPLFPDGFRRFTLFFAGFLWGHAVFTRYTQRISKIYIVFLCFRCFSLLFRCISLWVFRIKCFGSRNTISGTSFFFLVSMDIHDF